MQQLSVMLLVLVATGTHAADPSRPLTDTIRIGRSRAPSSPVGMSPRHLRWIDPAVQVAIDQGDVPGCVVSIQWHGKQQFLRAYGHRQVEPEPIAMTVDTVFDMASLTKPIATATSLMVLVERGQVRLGDAVADYLDAFAQNGKEDVTLLQLLTHQAGFVPDSPLADYQVREEIWPRLMALPLDYPSGTRFVYSDVGYQILGKLIEEVSGQALNKFTWENIFEPLGMVDTGFLPKDQQRRRAAPTERRNGQWMRGDVHDPRAWAMGGVAGHAGLFSTASDLARYAQMMLGRGRLDDVRVLSAAAVREMTAPHFVGPKAYRRGLGWDIRSKYSTNRGELMSDLAFGHGGFTGTAMWIDPDLQLVVIVLSNRLHPDGEGKVNQLASRIANIAVAAIGREGDGKCSGVSTSQTEGSDSVVIGIDRLARDQFQQLAGRSVGLITNHTGLDSAGRRTIDLLHAAEGVKLVAIFSPEHGIAGTRDDNQIQDARDSKTGVPIYSLYGPRKRPDSEQLNGVETLVFDIQDIGTRFYTYISTMGHAMESAAELGKAFVVLDRPNPLGGCQVAGPLMDVGRESFVGYFSMPVRHGMTVGELARMFRAERSLDLDLQIIPTSGWDRSALWDATGKIWINPSPNMRSWTQALLYCGVGLLETTNLSVGRGTDTPFQWVGAPWIDPRDLAQRMNSANLPGVRFVGRYFTPAASKFAGQRCGAIEFLITDRRQLAPVRLGLELAVALREMYADQWEIDRMDRLLRNAGVLKMLREGRSAQEIEMAYQQALSDFCLLRAKYLLY